MIDKSPSLDLVIQDCVKRRKRISAVATCRRTPEVFAHARSARPNQAALANQGWRAATSYYQLNLKFRHARRIDPPVGLALGSGERSGRHPGFWRMARHRRTVMSATFGRRSCGRQTDFDWRAQCTAGSSELACSD
jgi:hypothetical protein